MSSAIEGWLFGIGVSLVLLLIEVGLDHRNRQHSLPRLGTPPNPIATWPVRVVDLRGASEHRSVFVGQRSAGQNLDQGVWVSRELAPREAGVSSVFVVPGFAIFAEEAIGRMPVVLHDGSRARGEAACSQTRVTVFPWGTVPCLAAYRRDLRLAEDSGIRTALRDALRGFLQSCGAPRCVLVAHSMGSRLLLGEIGAAMPAVPPLVRRVEVVLLNPEVEADVGLGVMAQADARLHFRVLASDDDGHLTAAEIFGPSGLRLGHITCSEMRNRGAAALDRFDCCDVPAQRSSSAHGFFWNDERGARWVTGLVANQDVRCPN